MRLLLIMRLLLFTIGLKLSRGYYNRGGYYPSAVTITGNTVYNVGIVILCNFFTDTDFLKLSKKKGFIFKEMVWCKFFQV